MCSDTAACAPKLDDNTCVPGRWASAQARRASASRPASHRFSAASASVDSAAAIGSDTFTFDPKDDKAFIQDGDSEKKFVAALEKENAAYDKKLAQEEIWIRKGIKARRTRNMGRVRDLIAMREERAQRRKRIGSVHMEALEAEKSGKLVMEVKFTEYLPQIVRDILPPRAQELTAVSKYVLCCDKTAYQHGFEYWNET